MKKVFICAAMLWLSSGSFAQDYLAKNEYFYSLINRLDLLVIGDSLAGDKVSLGIAFGCGSFKQRDGFEGLPFLYERIVGNRLKQHLRQNIPEYGRDTTVVALRGETSYEYVSLQLTFSKKHLDRILQTIYESVSSPLNENEVAEAISFSNYSYQNAYADPSFGIGKKIGMALWEDDYGKRNVIKAWDDSAAVFVPRQLTKLKTEYLCPRNCFMVIRGSVPQKSVYESAEKFFLGWERCTINPFTRFPAPNYRTILNSFQLVEESQMSQVPFFRVAFPGPNTFEDKRSNYCALVLSGTFSSPESKIYQFLRDSCGAVSATLQNDLAKFISQLTFELTPGDSDLACCYECFGSFLRSASDSLIDERELQLGKEAIIADFRKRKADIGDNIPQILKFWASVSLNDYSTFEDSIRSISTKDVQSLLDRYFRKRHYVAALSISPQMRSATAIDSAFTVTANDVRNYRITFLKNSATFSSADDDSILNSLIQFLKINPASAIKVNGVCHKDELLEVSDKEMFHWLHSYSGFIMNPPSLIEKRKFRLDVYRSVTIMKKLTEAGIDIKRLFGTGNLVKTPGETDKYQYAYFTEMVN